MVEEGQELREHFRRIGSIGGRKKGENARRRHEFQERVLDALNVEFYPPKNMAGTFDRLNLREKDGRVSIFAAIVGRMAFDAMNGDHKARMDLFELAGLTPNARRNNAQARAVERLLETADGPASDDGEKPLKPVEIEAEIRKLGVYDA